MTAAREPIEANDLDELLESYDDLEQLLDAALAGEGQKS